MRWSRPCGREIRSCSFAEEEPFGGFARDAAATSAVVAGVSHPDPVVRRVSAEILGNISLPEARDALVRALEDEDPNVRTALLRSLAKSEATPAILEVLMCLQDEDPEVRQQAVESLRTLSGYPRGVIVQVYPLLHDPDPAVRASSCVTILEYGPHSEALDVLVEMTVSEDLAARLEAYRAIEHWHAPEAHDMVVAGLRDESPAVRRAAAVSLAKPDAEHCVAPLIEALADQDGSVREAAATALGQIGPTALAPTLEVLKDPGREAGALLALETIPLSDSAERLQSYARGRFERALHDHNHSQQVARVPTTPQVELLAESLNRRSHHWAINGLRAIGLIKNRIAVHEAVQNLESHDPNQRATALEILETIDYAPLVRPVLVLWEPLEDEVPENVDWLENLLGDEDPWIRACTVLVAGSLEEKSYRSRLTELARNDSDQDVRAAARNQIKIQGDDPVETLQTLSLMERILFLRRVPLFADLPPSDLKRVASIANESLFQDGETIVEQGESGEEMFIIVSGEVGVILQDEGGEQIEVVRRQEGEYVGEMSILSDEPRMATLKAIGEVRTLCIGQKAFQEILRERPETSLAVMRVLCVRLREQTMT